MTHQTQHPLSESNPGASVAKEAGVRTAHPNYFGVFVFLGILTALEVTLVSLFPATVGRVPILLTLTVAKGLLVALYYMHLRFDSRIYAWFFGAGIFAFGVPLVIALILMMAPPTLQRPVLEGGAEGTTAQVARPTLNPNAGPPITFTTEGGEFYFKPDTLTVNAGQAVNVVLENVGSVEHTFVLAGKPKTELPEPWLTNDGSVIAKANAGQTGRGGFIAPAPGQWIFYCNVPGHAAAGMFGTLIVQ